MNDSRGKPIIVLWVISLLAVLDTLTLVYSTDGWAPLCLALGYLIVVVAVESIFLMALGFKGLPGWPQPLLASTFAAVNLISVKLAFSEKLLSLGNPAKISLTLVAIAVLYHLTTLAWPVQKRILLSLTLFLGIFSFTQTLVRTLSTAMPIKAAALKDYDEIRLRERPDIHVISFDSMIPDVIARKHLGLSAHYQDFLESNAIVFRNAFSIGVPTRASLNALLRLDDDRFHGHGFFSGTQLGPVLLILKNNGYKITTGFMNGYFGPKGKHVDAYHVSGATFLGISASAMCLDKASTFLGIPRFLGLCMNQFDSRSNFKRWPAEVRMIVNQPRGNYPTFTLHHIYVPIGHTKLSFESDNEEHLSEYSEYFAKQAMELTSQLTALKAGVMAANPQAIIMILGDHGVWLSRTKEYEDNPKFFILDRHAISLSVLKTDNQCARDYQSISAYISDHATPSRVLAGIIRCLSEESRAVDHAVRFSTKHAFSKFRYENNTGEPIQRSAPARESAL